ncbi:hypothetical protein ACKLNR_006181 [Fusarium oxysporum f. sp. zingiberi]
MTASVIVFVGVVVKGLAGGVFRGSSGAKTYRQHAIGIMVKALTSTFSPSQLQYINETFDEIYLKFCKTRKLTPGLVTGPSGVTGFWIGPKTAKYIIINFHGGGFAMDGTVQHLEFWTDVREELLSAGINTASYYPMYTLIPQASYPVQFDQAVEALRYVLEDLGRSPQDVILAGDSAGGNLCLAILSHLSHQSGDVSGLEVSSPLKGMILMSPWLSFKTSWPSMKQNIDKDIDSLEALEEWSGDYLNHRTSDNYAEAIRADREWWMNALVERTLVVAGADEVFVDPVTLWIETFKAAGNEITSVIAKDECHIAPFIWRMFGDTRETQQGQAIKSWLNKELQG